MPNTPVKTAYKLDRNVQLQIGQGLRRMYDGLVAKPLPNSFLELLAKLDDKMPPARAAE
jgi:hypothetical protein